MSSRSVPRRALSFARLLARHAGGAAAPLLPRWPKHGDGDALLARVLLVAQRLEQRLQAMAADARELGPRSLLDVVGAVALALDEARHVAQVEIDEHR